ncbi:hypothetical protein C2E25_10865 [Geothermobacter hydrogeniphilus]|uniref:diguanylate cyclase n=2 Tax=Geothermobacter hydrogeniphilus TaxID=1969733 RepID=A0A2K2H998_9BACT|nr:hypothetical protein C2E25_10865 [Geothermobacter hydrogeniphilus]
MRLPMPARFNRLPLTQKILLPFFLVLVLLGLTATIGSVQLTSASLSESIDQQLDDQHSLLEMAIKNEEQRLTTFANLLVALSPDDPEETGTIPLAAHLNGLSSQDLSARIWSEQQIGSLEQPQLKQMVAHARRSGKTRVRFFPALPETPALVLVKPLKDKAGDQRYIMIRRTLGQKFFRSLMKPTRGDCHLLDRNGNHLVSNRPEASPPRLSADEISRLIAGRRVNKTTATTRTQFFAVPLGTSDLVLLGVSLPTRNLGILVRSLATRSAITVLLALVLFGYFFLRFIRGQLRPLGTLLQATETVSRGQLDYRLPDLGNDEIGKLAQSFNSMVSQLDELYREKIDQQRQLTEQREELKYRELLEAKNAEIERANHELRAHLKEMSGLFQLNRAMTSTLDLGILFDRMMGVLKDLIHCDRMVLFTYNAGSEELLVRKTHGIDPELLQGMTFRLDEGITGKAALTQRLLSIPDLKNEKRNLGYKGKSHSGGSMVSVPLVVKKRLSGVLNLHKIETDAFSESDINLVQAVANQAAIAIENSQLYEQARSLSNTDELTGLANRRHFQMILKREVAQAQRYHSHFSLIMADIDHFKAFNDTHGHLRGDIVLKKVADILLQNTRGIDLVGRFGGEEFIVLLPKTDKHGAEAAAEKLRSCVMNDSFPGEEESQPEGTLTLSLGIAEYPNDSKDIYELLDLADRALYRAKEEGRNRFVTWQSEMHTV